MNYRGVMFDLGGTLFDDLPAYRVSAVQRRALGEAGLQTSGIANLESTFRKARRDVEQTLRRTPSYAHRDLVEQHFMAGVTALGLKDQLADPSAAASRYADLMRVEVINGLRLKRDCHEVLSRLAELGCDLTVVSNNDEGYLQALIHKWALQHRFRHWLSSDCAGVCKPDPRIFAMGLAGADMPLSNVLYVGDSVADDVVGARAAGMDVALLTANASSADTGATYCIRSLDELIQIVAP